jgi:membrane associated rhomboid family serine protease
VLWAAFFNFIAFAFFGTKVADTVGQTVKPGFASVAVIFAALLGSILWLRRHEESGNETVFKAGQALLVATGHLQASGDKLPIPAAALAAEDSAALVN